MLPIFVISDSIDFSVVYFLSIGRLGYHYV